jgi:hypothetical protein
MSKTVDAVRWWDRWNRAVFPWMGPAQLGPFGEPPLPPSAEQPCPLCGAAMNEHSVERPGGRVASRLHCPQAAA